MSVKWKAKDVKLQYLNNINFMGVEYPNSRHEGLAAYTLQNSKKFCNTCGRISLPNELNGICNYCQTRNWININENIKFKLIENEYIPDYQI